MFPLQFPYRIYSKCLSSHWEALDDAVADGPVLDSQYVFRIKVNTRDEWSIFERMVFLRLVHVNTPVSVSMLFNYFSY